MLEIKDFSKIYSSKHKAVDALNLNVKNGEIVGFIGHNGAGKTTTIKSMVGILEYDTGDFILDGISLKKQPLLYKKDIAYTPDSPNIYENLTGIQYLNFVADMYDMNKQDRIDTIKKFAEGFEIYNCLGDLISGFSHGMKQKITLISAFMHSPKIIIMDEPFVGLDPKASYSLKQIMREHCNNGNSIFFSTHGLEVAEKICDSIAIIKDGRLVMFDKTEKIVADKDLEKLFMEVLDSEGTENQRPISSMEVVDND